MVEGHLVNKNTPEAGVCAGAGVMGPFTLPSLYSFSVQVFLRLQYLQVILMYLKHK